MPSAKEVIAVSASYDYTMGSYGTRDITTTDLHCPCNGTSELYWERDNVPILVSGSRLSTLKIFKLHSFYKVKNYHLHLLHISSERELQAFAHLTYLHTFEE